MNWILKSLRPKEWYKNSLIFPSLIFSGNLFNGLFLLKTVLAFIIFCLAGVAVSIFNKFLNKNGDKFEPQISYHRIEFTLVILALAALFASFFLNTNFGIIILVYFAVSLLYAYFLHEVVFVDILTLGSIFSLVTAGGYLVINQPPSLAAISLAFLLGLFITTAERKLKSATLPQTLLDQFLLLTATSSIILYSLFALQGKFSLLIFTLPLVIYGMLQIFLLLSSPDSLSKPLEEILGADKNLLICFGSWILAVVLIVYL